jgi:methylmalonyl-CoA mutase N-terminal domain/subunit
VSIASVDDLEALLADIPLDSVQSISTTANSIGPMMLGLFLALSRRRGVDPSSFVLRLQNDVLKEHAARGTQIFAVEHGVKLTIDVIEYCAANIPTWTPICISGYHMRDAGGTRAQELGFTLANTREYLRRSAERGVSVSDLAPTISWFLSAGVEVLHEAAKMRAARELWATMLHDEFGVRTDKALKVHLSTYTLGGELSPYEITNNAVRVGLAALGAVLGGVQRLTCSAIDEAIGLPTSETALLSIRTQQIILQETSVGDVVDPLGGSVFVEGLTTALVDEARLIAQSVEERGGALNAIASGWVREQIDESAWQSQLERSATPRVGEAGATADDVDAPSANLTAHYESERRERFVEWKARRQRGPLDAAVSRLDEGVRSNQNLVDLMADVFEADGTIGEVVDVLVGHYELAPERQMRRAIGPSSHLAPVATT